MNGTMMSTSQMLNSLTQLLTYSNSMFHTGNEESYTDEQMPSTSAADSQTASSALTKYLQLNEASNEATQSNNSGDRQQQSSSRRRLRRERVHPVSAYFLVTDEESKCAICILCFNVMKASKTANLMRHMTRYHKTVAADLERQWDIIKGSKLKYRSRDEAALTGAPSTNASPLNNESSENGSPFLGPEASVPDGLLNASGGEPKGGTKTEPDCENGGAAVVTQTDPVKPRPLPVVVDVKMEAIEKDVTESTDAQMQQTSTEMPEESDGGTSNPCPSCVKRTTDTALLVTLLKRQDQLHKKTERLIEEHVDREKLFEEKQEEFWKRANALMKSQEEQQRVLYGLTSKVEAIVEHLTSQSSS